MIRPWYRQMRYIYQARAAPSQANLPLSEAHSVGSLWRFEPSMWFDRRGGRRNQLHGAPGHTHSQSLMEHSKGDPDCWWWENYEMYCWHCHYWERPGLWGWWYLQRRHFIAMTFIDLSWLTSSERQPNVSKGTNSLPSVLSSWLGLRDSF